MSKCVLSIELESPDAVHVAGGTVRGHVRVVADADVRCRRVSVYAGWRTHGLGNVAEETAASVDVFSGELSGGQSLRIPFEVKTLLWPPTYQGFHIQIEHFIEATADIPWAFDPKVSVPIHVRAGGLRSDELPPSVTANRNTLSAIIFIAVVLMTMGVIPAVLGNVVVVALLASLLGILGAVLLLVLKWLPAMYVGQAEFAVESLRLTPGESLVGSLSLRPSRTIHPQFVSVRLLATEICSSGSGSNRKQHRHELFDRTIYLAERPTIPGNQQSVFRFQFVMPPLAAFSFALTDNELQWSVSARIGIPGLVDWKRNLVLVVLPPTDTATAERLVSAIEAPRFAGDHDADLETDGRVDQGDDDAYGDQRALAAADARAGEEGISFAETAALVWSVRDQPDQIATLVDAVHGLPLPMTARIQRRWLVGSREDTEMAHDEYLVTAEAIDPPLPLALYVPKRLGDEFEAHSAASWSGQGEIVGWDPVNRRLQIRVHVENVAEGYSAR